MKIIHLSSDVSVAVEPIFAQQLKDENTILIFLHEALGSIAQWKSFPQELCNAMQLNGIVYERQGHGSSSKLNHERNEHYLHNYAFLELPKLLEKILSPEKKVVLVGHSDGASIALLFASRYPKNVLGVVSMAAHVIVEDITLKGIAPAITAFEAKKLEGLRKYHGEKTDELFYAWANTWNLPSFRDWNICNEISSITCPVLALQGKNDQYGSEQQLLLIKEHVKGKTNLKMIENCGHHPHLEKQEVLIEEIVKWYNSSIETEAFN